MQTPWALLGVKPHETRRVSLFALYSMAVVGGVVITGGLAGRALFLSGLPREFIGLKFVLPPLALAAFFSQYARVYARVRRDRLVAGSSLVLAAMVLGLRAGLGTSFGESLPFLSLLFVLLELASSLAIIQFWTLAGDVFDARQARRLFGLIAAGGTAAAVLFSLGLGASASRLPAENLLFIVAASLLLAGAFAAGLGESTAAPSRDPEPAEPPARSPLRELFGPPLVRSIAGIVITAAVASAIADYQLDLALQARYGADSAGMVRFLGVLRACAGAVALIIQVFFANRLLARRGLRGGLLALPVLMLVGQAAIVVTGGALFAAALPKAADGALKFDLNNTSTNLLYMPVPSRTRGVVKALLDGVLKPVVLSALGGIFLLAGLLPSITLVHWAFPALLVGGSWVLFVRSAALSYIGELRMGLRQRRLTGEAEPISLADEMTWQVLVGALASPDPALVLQALSLLEEADAGAQVPDLGPLMRHASVEVRWKAVQLAAGQEAGLGVDPLHELLEGDESLLVRGAALLALASRGGPEAASLVLPYLDDDRPELRAAAVRAALLHLGIEGVLHAALALREMLESSDALRRMDGARVLGELGARSFYRPLLPLLVDPEPDVRAAAVRAAEDLAVPALVEPLLALLDEPRLARQAQRALAACLDGDPRPIEARLGASGVAPRRRLSLVHVLARMPAGAHRDEALGRLLGDADGRVRGAAARALRTDGHGVAAAAVQDALSVEERVACELAVAVRGVGVDASLTAGALRDRLAESRDRALDLIALVQPGLPVDSLRESLRAPDRRVRATALELLDNVVEPGRRPVLIPLAELDVPGLVAHAEARLRLHPRERLAALGELARGGDPWLCACVVADLGRNAEGPEIVQGALDHEDPLVRETAARAAQSLNWERAARTETDMAMTTLEKVLFLKSIPLFESLPSEAIGQIAPIARAVQYAKGDVVLKQGDQGDCLYVIVEGTVDVRGEHGTVATESSRAILGELAVLTHRPRNADCVAMTDLVMLRIDKDDFWALLDERPELSTGILRGVVARYL